VSCLSSFACAVLQCSLCPLRRARPLRRPRLSTSGRRRVRGSIGGRDGLARPAITSGLAAVVADSTRGLRNSWRRPLVSHPRECQKRRPRVRQARRLRASRDRRRDDTQPLNARFQCVQPSGLFIIASGAATRSFGWRRRRRNSSPKRGRGYGLVIPAQASFRPLAFEAIGDSGANLAQGVENDRRRDFRANADVGAK
jgi:hypothetical protein